ncbi:MAG: sulfate transporter family protein [Pseudomonadota bacterium]
MVIAATRKALGELFDPAMRQVFWKAIGLTIASLILLWFGLVWTMEAVVPVVGSWFGMELVVFSVPIAAQFGGPAAVIATILFGLLSAAMLAFLIGPVSAAIAGIFLDEVAEHVERQDYPGDQPGTALPVGQSIIMSVKFFGIVIVGNLLAILLWFVPGITLIAFFAVNGYLLGREYFQLAAMRFHNEADTKALFSANSRHVLLAGFVIAGFMAIPLLNLLTPLFGAALMVHLHKAIEATT